MTPLSAQDGTVSVPISGISVGDLLKQIESQTAYLFVIESSKFDKSSTLSLKAGRYSVKEVMETISLECNYSYIIRGKYIIIDSSTPRVRAQPAQAPSNVSRTGDVYRRTDPRNIIINRETPQKGEPRKVAPAPDTTEKVLTKSLDTTFFATPYSDYRNPDLYRAIENDIPSMAVKTNALYTATYLALNAGIEHGITERSTVELTGSWYPWASKKTSAGYNARFDHWIVRGEYRHWFCERFDGHFAGAHAFYADYDIDGYRVPMLFEKKYRYDGYAIGAGLSYGYHYPLGRKWGIEAHVGVGFAYLKYRRGDCSVCELVAKEGKRSEYYFGPTRAGISLVFMIK